MAKRMTNSRMNSGKLQCELDEGHSWDEVSIGTQMLNAMRQVAVTLGGKHRR